MKYAVVPLIVSIAVPDDAFINENGEIELPSGHRVFVRLPETVILGPHPVGRPLDLLDVGVEVVNIAGPTPRFADAPYYA